MIFIFVLKRGELGAYLSYRSEYVPESISKIRFIFLEKFKIYPIARLSFVFAVIIASSYWKMRERIILFKNLTRFLNKGSTLSGDAKMVKCVFQFFQKGV